MDIADYNELMEAGHSFRWCEICQTNHFGLQKCPEEVLDERIRKIVKEVLNEKI